MNSDNTFKVTFPDELAKRLRAAFADPKNPNRLAYNALSSWLSELVAKNMGNLPAPRSPGDSSTGAGGYGAAPSQPVSGFKIGGAR